MIISIEDSMSNYGAVYAIQQMSVSLAYSLGPMLGGAVAQKMGFRWLMFIVGTINIVYGLCLFALMWLSSKKVVAHRNMFELSVNYIYFDQIFSDGTTIHLTDKSRGSQQQQDYKRFYNTIEIP